MNVLIGPCNVLLHHIMTTAVERNGPTRRLIIFLLRIFCVLYTKQSQMIHRNDLKIKCKYKN